MMKMKLQFHGRFVLVGSLVLLHAGAINADDGRWDIVSLPYSPAYHPVINNSGEIVWSNGAGWIYSSVRGVLTMSGINPHLANGGEVVYAGWFGGPKWDLVSTTRGRLTFGSIIDVNRSDFDVNSSGEVVHVVADTNYCLQVYSTVRGQITSGATDHRDPCINDNGEIAWTEYIPLLGTVTVSSTRGILPVPVGGLCDLNNLGEYCLSISIEAPPPLYYTCPHIYSSAHGVVIPDPIQYQWGAGINDFGTIVWDQGAEGLFQANWVPFPRIGIVRESRGFALEWSTNVAPGTHVQYTTNLFSGSGWLALAGTPTTNGGTIRLPVQPGLGAAALFRLSNALP